MLNTIKSMPTVIKIFILLLIFGCTKAQPIPINNGGSPLPINNGSAPIPVNPTNEVPLYIAAGQSNCGNAFLSESTAGEIALYDKTYTNVKIYNRYLAMTSFANMDIGTNTNSSGGEGVSNPGEYGFEASLFKLFNDTLPNRNYYFIKYGHTGTSLGGVWKHTFNGLNFDKLMIAVADAVDEIIADGKVPVLKAFFWVQGEADATAQSFANAYLTNLTGFFNQFNIEYSAIRTARNLSSDTTYLKVITENDATAFAPAIYRATVTQAKIDYCANASNNAVFVETQDLPVIRVVHWTSAGQITLGSRFFNLVRNL